MRISDWSSDVCSSDLAATFGWPSHAQTWKPQHSVEFVVPAGPGAALDTAARELQRLLEQQKILDQTLVITNRPGGSGAVGLQTLRAHEGDSPWVGTSPPRMLTARLLPPAPLASADTTPIPPLPANT